MPRIGIDIEEVARWREPGRKLTHLFSVNELDWATTQPDAAVAHAQLWCAKEAIFKAVSDQFEGSVRMIGVAFVDGVPTAHIQGRDDLASRVEVTISREGALVTACALLAPKTVR